MQEMDTTSILLLTDENPSSLLVVSVPGIYKILLNILQIYLSLGFA